MADNLLVAGAYLVIESGDGFKNILGNLLAHWLTLSSCLVIIGDIINQFGGKQNE
jgi:hypothetical protein